MKKIFFALFFSLCLLVPQTALAAGSATFSWSQNAVTVGANSETSVQLSINTAGNNTTGADAVLNYDPTKVEISSISFSNPNLYSNNFGKFDVGSGTISINSTFTDVSSKYNGTGSLATITFKGLSVGSTSFTWSCTDGSTKDSNILQQTTATDLINCAALTPLSISVTQSGSSTTTSDTTTTTTTSNNAQGSSTTSCSALNSAPTNLVAKVQSNSSVLLTWTKESNASHYTLKYGTSANSYQFGASNIGNTGSFVVNYLRPSTTYYFAVAGVNGCSTSSFITTSAKTSGGTVAAAPIKDSTPSFNNIVAQVAQTAAVPVPTVAPLSDERLPAQPIGQEAFLPTKAQTPQAAPAASSLPTSSLPLVAIAAAAVGIVGAIGVGTLLFRKRPTLPVTSVPEAPVSADAPQLEEVGKKPTEIPELK